jgi:hypothetical protein
MINRRLLAAFFFDALSESPIDGLVKSVKAGLDLSEQQPEHRRIRHNRNSYAR